MKLLLPFILLYGLITHLSAQPSIEWQKALGGTGTETLFCINLCNDGGYIAAGTTSSNNGDASGNHGSLDWWVVKLSATGQVQWQKCLGGTSYENATSVAQASDGGYIVAGKTNSNDGDVSGLHGSSDYWVVKLNVNGDIEWQKTLGGSQEDYAFSIQTTIDGGFAVAGYSASSDGDVTSNHGYLDYWIVKLSSTGAIEWEKSLGGSDGADQAFFMRHTMDGGYILVGESGSSDGDISNSQGGTDFWVVKLDSIGDIEWERSLGGDAGDAGRSIMQAADGGYVVVGEVGSNNSGHVTDNHGLNDYWVVRLSPDGELEWQKTLGGSDSDWARSVCQAPDGGYVVPGLVYSTDGDAAGCEGADILVVKLSADGENIEWKKIVGGSDFETVHSIVRTPDGGYILAGETYSNDGDVSGNHGGRDAWVVKLAPESASSIPNITGEALPLAIFPNPATQEISFNIPAEEPLLSISITDLTGRKVCHKTLSITAGLDVSFLKDGFYTLTATTITGKLYFGRFVRA